MASKAKYKHERIVKRGEDQKRCARCGKKIKPGNERPFGGRFYGSECIQLVMDKENNPEAYRGSQETAF